MVSNIARQRERVTQFFAKQIGRCFDGTTLATHTQEHYRVSSIHRRGQFASPFRGQRGRTTPSDLLAGRQQYSFMQAFTRRRVGDISPKTLGLVISTNSRQGHVVEQLLRVH